MNEKIGKRIELLIFEKGFPSIRKFTEYLKECNPQGYVSEDTVANVIKGKGIQNNTLIVLAQGLDMPVDCLTAETLPSVDNYLFNEVEPVKKEMTNGEKNNKELELNNLENVKRLYDIDKRMYPETIGNMYDEYNYKITTLAELSIYFPLCDMGNIMDVVCRISGEITGYENYVLKQYARLYENIPNIPAKKYADYQAVMLRLSSKEQLNHNEQKFMNEMKEFEKSDMFEKGYQQYTDIARRKYDLFHNDIMHTILKGKIPEVTWCQTAHCGTELE